VYAAERRTRLRHLGRRLACDRREVASTVPHDEHSRDVFLASTSTIVRTAFSAFSTINYRKIDQPACKISRFKPPRRRGKEVEQRESLPHVASRAGRLRPIVKQSR
jgi:hypothetical protein